MLYLLRISSKLMEFTFGHNFKTVPSDLTKGRAGIFHFVRSPNVDMTQKLDINMQEVGLGH